MHYYLYDRSRSAIHPKSVRTNERPVRPPQPSDACNEYTKRPPPFPDYPESQPQTMHVFLTFCHKSSHNALLPSRSVSIDRHRRRRDPRRCPVVRDREKKINQSAKDNSHTSQNILHRPLFKLLLQILLFFRPIIATDSKNPQRHNSFSLVQRRRR